MKIKDYRGYEIHMDTEHGRFSLMEGEDTIAAAHTLKEIEGKAKKRSTTKFTRVPFLKVFQMGNIERGDITSFNHSGREAWATMPDNKYRKRQKLSLHSGGRDRFEATKANNERAKEIEKHAAVVGAAIAAIKAMEAEMEKPINLEYFGIES